MFKDGSDTQVVDGANDLDITRGLQLWGLSH